MKSNMHTDIKKDIKQSISAMRRNEIGKEALNVIASIALAMEMTSTLHYKFTEKIERHERTRR